MPAPSRKPIPKLDNAVLLAKGNAVVLTQSLRAAHRVACDENPLLAIMLLDMIDRASRLEHRLTEVVTLQDEMRRK